jgi:hypothetical protein
MRHLFSQAHLLSGSDNGESQLIRAQFQHGRMWKEDNNSERTSGESKKASRRLMIRARFTRFPSSYSLED